MRNLATVAVINDVKAIEGADAICAYKVRNWWVVDRKDKYTVGQKVVYYEIDSLLPIKEEFEFLRKTSYKKMVDGVEGFRLKTIKLRGQVSQGLITELPADVDHNSVEEDFDLTEILGVIKYDPPTPFSKSGDVRGSFPNFIPKTDEERIQNIKPTVFNSWKNVESYVTEKIDGSSITVYYNNGKFGVCSRNQELNLDPDNSYVKAAMDLNLEVKMTELGKNLAIQGELHGFGIQGNNYKKAGRDIAFFTAFNIDTQQRLSFEEFMDITNKLGIITVPILNDNFTMSNSTTIEDIIGMADGDSNLHSNAKREGIVIRGKNNEFSVKSISNKWLIKHEN